MLYRRNVGNLLVGHFLYELETNLGLSNPSHSPEETWASWHLSARILTTEYLLKFIKYILPSSKDWTRIGLLSQRGVYLPSNSIGSENIDIVLSIELVLKSHTATIRLTVKAPPLMKIFWAFGKKPDLECCACWSSVTNKNIFVSVTHGVILFWFRISQVGLRYGIRRGVGMGYRSHSQSGDWSRNSVFMGSLINDEI